MAQTTFNRDDYAGLARAELNRMFAELYAGVDGSLTQAEADALYKAIGYIPAWVEITGRPATFPPSSHSHAAGDITSGTMATARLGSGTANSTTFLRGDSTYAVPPSAVAATESAPGVVEHATQAEVEAGAAGNLVATAARLKAELDRRATIEAWAAPTLQNGWTNFGSGNATAGYCKHNGLVVVKGLVASGTLGATVFTLPAGYRPLEIQQFSAVASGNAYGRIVVNAAGELSVAQGSATWTSLADVRFRAEQ